MMANKAEQVVCETISQRRAGTHHPSLAGWVSMHAALGGGRGQWFEGALQRLLLRPPSYKFCAVAKAPPGEVVVLDLTH
jgi:hypothetical protein